MTARAAALNALVSASPHWRVETTPPEGSSFVCGTQPVSSLAHEVAPGASLQSKCLPRSGGVASEMLDKIRTRAAGINRPGEAPSMGPSLELSEARLPAHRGAIVIDLWIAGHDGGCSSRRTQSGSDPRDGRRAKPKSDVWIGGVIDPGAKRSPYDSKSSGQPRGVPATIMGSGMKSD